MIPMTAHNFTNLEQVPEFCCIQPKYDGYRCLLGKDGAISRTGKRIYPGSEILKMCDLLKHTEITLDGELYIHGVDFSKVQSAVSKQDDGHAIKQDILYVIYDCKHHRAISMPFYERWYLLLRLNLVPRCILASTICVESKSIDKWHDIMTKNGFEGLMIRNPEKAYEHKRSKHLLKYKKFKEDEYEIVDIIEGAGKNKGTAVLVCGLDDKTFTVTSPGAYDQKTEIWKNRDKYLGKQLTVKFFEKTKNGIPRFPVALGIKDHHNQENRNK